MNNWSIGYGMGGFVICFFNFISSYSKGLLLFNMFIAEVFILLGMLQK